MPLESINGVYYQYPGAALDAAIAHRNESAPMWIIMNGPMRDYAVCIEVPYGNIKKPICQAWIGVFVETDRFTDPIFRINLGPGVWPIGEE